jgi:hypothetical protein
MCQQELELEGSKGDVPRLLAPDNKYLRRWRKGMFSDFLTEINPKKIMESLMKHRDTERTMGDFLRHGMIFKKHERVTSLCSNL